MHMVRVLVWCEVGKVNVVVFGSGGHRISSYRRGG